MGGPCLRRAKILMQTGRLQAAEVTQWLKPLALTEGLCTPEGVLHPPKPQILGSGD